MSWFKRESDGRLPCPWYQKLVVPAVTKNVLVCRSLVFRTVNLEGLKPLKQYGKEEKVLDAVQDACR